MRDKQMIIYNIIHDQIPSTSWSTYEVVMHASLLDDSVSLEMNNHKGNKYLKSKRGIMWLIWLQVWSAD